MPEFNLTHVVEWTDGQRKYDTCTTATLSAESVTFSLEELQKASLNVLRQDAESQANLRGVLPERLQITRQSFVVTSSS
jgi:hypothetical protein